MDLEVRVKAADYSNLFLSFFTEDGEKMEEFQVSPSSHGNSRKSSPGILSACCSLELRKPRTTHFVCVVVPLTLVDSD